MAVIAGVHLASAALQVIAEDAGLDLLHIKGPAVDDTLLPWVYELDPETGETVRRPVPRQSSDADIVVRPAHIPAMFEAMAAHGWAMAYRFEDGSAFEHASTWRRPGLSWADVHRSFPGIGLDADRAFERLWADRGTATIAGYPCTVPSIPAQRLILILHATRGGNLSGADLQMAWGEASDAERAEVDALARDLNADVALAAGTGRLELHRGARDYALWKALAGGNASRLTLWSARVRAQPDVVHAVRLAFHLVMPKPGRLAHDLGRKPTAGELAREWVKQAGLAASEGAGGVVRLLRRGRRRSR